MDNRKYFSLDTTIKSFIGYVTTTNKWRLDGIDWMHYTKSSFVLNVGYSQFNWRLWGCLIFSAALIMVYSHSISLLMIYQNFSSHLLGLLLLMRTLLYFNSHAKQIVIPIWHTVSVFLDLLCFLYDNQPTIELLLVWICIYQTTNRIAHFPGYS